MVVSSSLTVARSTLATSRVRDALSLIAAASVYFIVREIVEGDEATAIANAEHVIAFERSVGIDIEGAAQDLVLDHDALRVLANFSYVWLHWPLLIVAFAILHQTDLGTFRRLRAAMCWSGAVGLLLFWVFPVAPPRFMPGFVGTVSDAERRHYLPFPMDWANRFAAFPSFHVGWTLIACFAVASVVRGRAWKFAAMVPPVLVALAVVGTGNHYVLDLVAGLVIAVVAYVAVPLLRSPLGRDDRHVDQPSMRSL